MPGSLAFLLAICVLCLHQQMAQACSCYPTHRQVKFCSSDIGKIYHFARKMNLIKIYTPSSGAACGIHLTLNEEYVLGGRVNSEGKFMVRSCDLVLEWNRLTVSEKYHIEHLYKKGCGCKIKGCLNHPCPAATPKECLWKDVGNTLPCLPCKDGTCQWTCDFPFPNQVGLKNAIKP
uniref:NTR domain-containing protein n=1 Tax=Eptatretus burgeri TaxID=7764 RepID=A0A8C4RAR2_EPTBU